MSSFKIPKDLKTARSALNGLYDLLTATEWERAAIVYAFTIKGRAGRPKKDQQSSTSGRLTCKKFAELGIQGLKSTTTVSQYRRVWQYAIDQKLTKAARAGKEVEAPELDFMDAWNAARPRLKPVEKIPGGAGEVSDSADMQGVGAIVQNIEESSTWLQLALDSLKQRPELATSEEISDELTSLETMFAEIRSLLEESAKQAA